MSASTNQLIEPSVERELEAQQPSPAQLPRRPISRDAPDKPSSRFVVLIKSFFKIKSAFKDAWVNISSPGWLQSPQSRRFGCQLLIIIWISGLLSLLIYLPLGSLSPFETPCQSDGEFNIDISEIMGSTFHGEDPMLREFGARVNRWALQSFFQVNLSWEVYDFTSVKLIDVTWDLIIGRGGQAIMSLIIWHVFTKHLEVAVASEPVTFTTLWLLRFHQDTSLLSTIRLFIQFFRRGLASRFAMFVMIIALSFTLAFSTIAGSMTGYATSNEPYVKTRDGKLFPFNDVRPLAYVIHDGKRMEGYSDNYAVPWTEGADRMFRYCTETYPRLVRPECEFQLAVSAYVQQYGFNANGSLGEAGQDNTTTLDNQQIDWPPLNISAYYLPSPFYWNFTAAELLYGPETYGEPSDIKYIVDSNEYSVLELKQHGVCQPTQDDEIQRYQWGFSFLQLYLVLILLFICSLALLGLWKQAHETLKLNHRETSSRHWKGLLDFTSAIRDQLKEANIDIDNLSDKQLQDEIQAILHGGSISSQPFCEGSPSIWCLLRQRKCWIGSYICIMTLLQLDLLVDLHIAGRFVLLFATCLFVAFEIGCTTTERGLLFVFASLFCIPLGFQGGVDNMYLLPGVFVGLFLASAAGSTKGSRFVLFTLPFFCNYLAIIILYS